MYMATAREQPRKQVTSQPSPAMQNNVEKIQGQWKHFYEDGIAFMQRLGKGTSV